MHISEYDNNSFERVARVLWRINPCLRGKYASEMELIGDMKFQTGCHLQEAGFWGTGGYYVSVVDRGERGFYAMASISGYVVDEYLKKLSQPEEKIPSFVSIWDTRRAYDKQRAQYIIAELYQQGNKHYIRFLDMSRSVSGYFETLCDVSDDKTLMPDLVMTKYDNNNFIPLTTDECRNLWRKAPYIYSYLFPNWLNLERASKD
jgi:hypothetical protein